MDADRFDRWTVALTAGVLRAPGSRRAALRLLVGGAGGALLGLLGREETAARCRHGKKRCGDKCIPKDDCCAGGQHLKPGDRYRQCGLCVRGGELRKTVRPCLALDPDFCTVCDERYRCVPGREGENCGEGTGTCGVCLGELCEDPKTGGAPFPCSGPPDIACCDGRCFALGT